MNIIIVLLVIISTLMGTYTIIGSLKGLSKIKELEREIKKWEIKY